jgi:carbonic anhydrase/acetyltransferase-like protein (isoleucine patch superfamily)
MVHGFEGREPLVRDAAFVAWNADISGDVELGLDVSVWYNATLRGDVAAIKVGDRANIQDGAVVHVAKDMPCSIGEDVTVGHGSIVHACTIGNRCLIGMGAIVLDGAVIGEDSIVGAGALVTGGRTFPPRSLILGSPAKAIRSLDEAEVASLTENARHYVELARVTVASLKP